jgi:uncharacterized membrane protein
LSRVSRRRKPPPRPARAPGAAPGGRTPAAPAAAPGFLERHGTALVLALAAGQAVVFGALCWIKYRHYLYTDFDLAIFAHAESNLLRGSLFESIGGMPWLGGHVSPVMFLLAPLWLVAPHPLTLLTLQAGALALGALPLHRMARRTTGSEPAALLLAAAYLLYPALGYTALFEFHPEALATPALIFAMDALHEGRPRAMLLWTTLALSTREDVALVVMGLALAAAIWRERRDARGLYVGGLAGLAAVSLLVSFGLVLPTFGSGATDYSQLYARWGGSFREVALSALRDPLRALGELFATPGDPADSAVKRLYYLQMLLPSGFLALLAPGALPHALPVLLEHFMATRLSQHTIVFHYTSLVTPFFAVAAVLGTARAARFAARRRGWPPARTALAVAAWALAGAVAAQVLYGPVANVGRLQAMGRPQLLVPDEYGRALEPHRDRLLARAPREGDVVAGFEFLPRFTDRAGLHSLHHLLAGHYTHSKRVYDVPRGVSTVLADLGAGSLFRYVDGGTAGRWRELIGANGLAPVASAGDLVLWASGARDTVALWSAAEPRAPRARPVVYDGEVAFLGSEQDGASVAAGGLLPLRTYWRRVAPTPRFHLAELVLVDRENRPRAQVWRYLGYTQHPAAEWPGGASVCETYRLAVPRDLPPGRYHLGLRLWWRDAGQGVCVPDDPAARADEGFVRVASFEVTAPEG